MSIRSEIKKKKYCIPPVKRQPVSFFKRTEGNVRYEYNSYISYIFLKWSSSTRDAGKEPKFSDFYNQLLPMDRATVKVELLNQTRQ